MSLNCGYLESIANNPKFAFKGEVALRNVISAAFVMVKNQRAKAESQAPDYFLMEAQNGLPTQTQIGSAWIKNSDRGADFLAITLDEATWPAPVYVTAFPPDGSDKQWRIVWSRPRAEKIAA